MSHYYTTLCNIHETIILSNWDPSYLNIKENSSQHECPPTQHFQMKKKKKKDFQLLTSFVFFSLQPFCFLALWLSQIFLWVAFSWGQTFGIFRHLGLVDPNFATKVGKGVIHVEMNFLWYLGSLDLNWIILLFQVYYKVLYNSVTIM